MIPIHRVHIRWNVHTKEVLVHEFLTPEDRQAPKMVFDTGACWGSWRERATDDLVREMCDLAMDLIVAREFDPHQVYSEFLKVKEFRRAGSRNHYLARVFSAVEDGQVSENLDRWADS